MSHCPEIPWEHLTCMRGDPSTSVHSSTVQNSSKLGVSPVCLCSRMHPCKKALSAKGHCTAVDRGDPQPSASTWLDLSYRVSKNSKLQMICKVFLLHTWSLKTGECQVLSKDIYKGSRIVFIKNKKELVIKNSRLWLLLGGWGGRKSLAKMYRACRVLERLLFKLYREVLSTVQK